ncbi:hypothetical protein LCGC14_0808010 [marine sediment metagenome]|uniref:Peptidase M15A C-terminal domain-containing protein n=1 Tax=marine sediment metagenome TaxID=412755 RepID=A0A0F9Q7P8_9ZZZZ
MLDKKFWETIKYFRMSEFDSPDYPGSGFFMTHSLVSTLNLVRTIIKLPIVINSGVRTVKHNKFVGGKDDSSHLTGDASDVHCPGDYFRFMFIDICLVQGIKRILIYKTFIHVDIDKKKPHPIIKYME